MKKDPSKTKDMMTVGELKAILQNWSDDTLVAVSIDNKTKPMNIKRTGMLAMNLYKNPDILTASLGLFLWRDE